MVNGKLSMKDARLSPGHIVRHFKREFVPQTGADNLYRILEFAKHSETGGSYVVYEALYGERDVYIRPYDMFMSEMVREEYPQVKLAWRFEKASPAGIALEMLPRI